MKTTSGAPRIGQISYSDVWEADKFIEQDFLTPLRAFTPEKLEDMDREDDDDRQEISKAGLRSRLEAFVENDKQLRQQTGFIAQVWALIFGPPVTTTAAPTPATTTEDPAKQTFGTRARRPTVIKVKGHCKNPPSSVQN